MRKRVMPNIGELDIQHNPITNKEKKFKIRTLQQ